MNTKVTSYLLIIGPILTLAMWMGLSGSFDTDGKTASEAIVILTDNETLVRIVSFISALGLTLMFLGLYFFSRSLKGDNTVSNPYAESGGLLLLLTLPIIVGVQFGSTAAVENATNPAIAEIMTNGARTFGNGFGFMLPTGMLLLSIAMIQQKKFNVILGYIIALDTLLALTISLVSGIGDGRWMPIILLFPLTLIIGVLNLLQKEN